MFRFRSGAPGAHSQAWGSYRTAGEIIDRVHSERLHAAAQETRARQAAIAAAFDAPTLTLPIQPPTADVIDAEIVAVELDDPDQPKTRPMSRYELFLEVDGGRPMHDLDYALVMGGVR